VSTQRILATLALVLGAAFWLVGLWKWALVGLDADVGMACGLTGLALIFVGGLGLIDS
jgi:hypothetical protein